MSRRSLSTTLLVTVLSLMTVTGLVLAVYRAAGGSFGLGGRIALLEVRGAIGGDSQFLDDVRRLRRDRSVRGWVVEINSPGGVVAPSQSIYDRLRSLRNEDGQPVVASIGGVGASGGYYVALGADSILALPGSITGSIGVIMEYPNVGGLMDRVGVRMEVVKAGAQKDMGSPFREMDPEERAILNRMLEDVHAQFIEAVAESRGMPVGQVRPLADGRIFSGREAMELGLVDRLGNRDAAIRLAGEMAGLGPEPNIVRPPRERGSWLLDALLGESAGAVLQAMTRGQVAGAGWPVVKYMVH